MRARSVICGLLVCACTSSERDDPAASSAGASGSGASSSSAAAVSSVASSASSGGGGSGAAGGSAAGGGGAGGAAGGAGGAAFVTPPECVAMAQALCARQYACRPAYAAISYLDVAMCEARNALACALDVEAGDSAWTAANALACAAAVPAVDCALVFSGAGPTCTPAPGARPDGSGCARDSQCQNLRCLRQADEQTCGVCIPPTVGGEPCNHKPTDCDIGKSVFCGTSDTCELPGTSGAACSASGYCVEGLVCDPATDLCVPGNPLGASCADILCYDPTAYTTCDVATETCVAVPILSHGESCFEGLCGGAAGCDFPSGTCAAFPYEGESCDQPILGCVPPAVCGDDELCALVHGQDCPP